MTKKKGIYVMNFISDGRSKPVTVLHETWFPKDAKIQLKRKLP